VFRPIPKAEHDDRTGSANVIDFIDWKIDSLSSERVDEQSFIANVARIRARERVRRRTQFYGRSRYAIKRPSSANPENSNRRSRLRGEPSRLEQLLKAKSVVVNSARSSTIEDVLRERRSTIENRLIPESTAVCRCDKVVVDCSETRRLCDSDRETERSERPPIIGAMS